MSKLMGNLNLERHLAGVRLTQRQAIHAKCCDCNNRYVDGPEDCRIPKCPLYPWMPYRKNAGGKAVRTGLEASSGVKQASDVSGAVPAAPGGTP